MISIGRQAVSCQPLDDSRRRIVESLPSLIEQVTFSVRWLPRYHRGTLPTGAKVAPLLLVLALAPGCSRRTESGSSLVAVPLTGCVSIGYSVPVTIGGQAFALSLDTGSTDLGVALTSCADCGVSPEYAASNGSCSGSTSSEFGAGSLSGGGWNAEVCAAQVQVGEEQPPVTMAVAGITTQDEFFIDYHCAGTENQGILGMGPIDLDTIGTASGDSYFPALVQQGVPDVLGILLCSTKGTLWLGGYDPDYASAPPQFTPMTTSDGWTVNLLGIGLGSQDLGGADTQSIVDTGTWGFYMPTAAFTALATAVANDSGAVSIFGAGVLGVDFFNGNYFTGTGCAAPLGNQTQEDIDAALPPMTLTLAGVNGGDFTLSLPATRSYLAPIPVGGKPEYCSGIADNSQTGNVTLMGDTVLQAYITVLDEANRQVGFAPQNYCP